MRVAFSDEHGDIIQAPIQWGFPQVFIEPPKEIEMQINPETGQVNFSVKGRWY